LSREAVWLRRSCAQIDIGGRTVKKLGIVALVLAAVVLLTPSLAQKSTAPDEKTKVCHQCEWLAIQISDIDEKIASWQRQTASINKYSNLADPNIQGALKDIANRISALKAKKAKLEAELAECRKRCAALSVPPPAPMTPQTPGGTHTGGGGTGGTAGGTTTGGTTGTTPTTPPVGEPCPPKPSGPKTTGPAAGIYVPPPVYPLPPLPLCLDCRDEWVHLLWHMHKVDSGAGDAFDLTDVIWDIEELIDDAYDDLVYNPHDARAEARLHWLYKQLHFYRLWSAVQHQYFKNLFYGKPECPPPKLYIVVPPLKLNKSAPTEDSPFYNPSGSYTPYGSGTPDKSGGGGAYPDRPYEPDQSKPNGQNAPDHVPGPGNIPQGTNGSPP
jgi:hypothetical protein